MKKTVFILVAFLIFSCKDKKQNEVSVSTIETKIDTVNEKELKNTEITVDTVRKFCTEDFYGILGENLIGMEEVSSETKISPFKRYQVDKEAVCYGRSLLKMDISQTKISISSYYNTDTYREYDIIECNISNDMLIIKTNSEEFSSLIIEKLKDVPIFSLKYEGSIMELEPYVEIMIGNYLAKESDIEKFGGIPDCGDFQG